MFAWFDDTGPLTRAFTDRHGGVSAQPYAELNLGDHVGDDPAAVAGNRAVLASALGLPSTRVAFMRQVHGARVAVVAASGLDGEGDGRRAPVADALVTADSEVGLVVMVADCIPVLLDDLDGGPIGVAHVGRPGLAAGVLLAVVDALTQLGATRLRAVLGPSICGGCYEVPEAMRAEVSAVVPQAFGLTRAGTPALDLGAGARAQLADLGGETGSAPGCTRERSDLFSFRRDGPTGRFCGVIVRHTT